MDNVKIEEAVKDLEEAKKFYEAAQQAHVKEALSIVVRKFESNLISLRDKYSKETNKSEATPKEEEAKSKPQSACYDKKITNYAWDQSEKLLKFYISLKGVQTIPKENVVCSFTSTSLELSVKGLDGCNHNLAIKNLLHPIDPESSSFKIKTDTLVVLLKKETAQTWSQITVQEKKAKDSRAPKFDESADPSQGLMDMLKQMYDEGDDDMKRTIAQAWTESRDKGAGNNLGF